LKQGAKLVANYIDVVEELNFYKNSLGGTRIPTALPAHAALPVRLSSEQRAQKPRKQTGQPQELPLLFEPDKYQKAVLNILESTPMHIDAIIAQAGLDTGGITAALMDLELMGIVKHSPGKMFYKSKE
jgi:predicted Rossmann fold nucleotide-binding protein DprA/Smf involved in DNA uptake